MKRFHSLFSVLALLTLGVGAWAAPVTFPGPTILDDTGTKVTPTSISVASVTDLDGNAIAAPGAVAHFAGANSSVVYDAATKGEAWITLTPVLAGHTFANNPPVIFCSVDPQTLAANGTNITSIKGQTDKLLFDGANFVKANAQTGNVATVGGQAPPTNWNLALIDAQGKTTFNNTSIGSVSGSVGSISGITFPANFGSVSIDTNGRVTLTPTEHGLFAGDVFNAAASGYNTANSLGQKLNAAGSAGNPWTTDISTGYSGTQAGALLYAVRAGQPVTLPNTPPTGYANPGYFYAPVLDTGTTQSSSLTVSITRNGSNQPVLTWSADANATSYKVLRSTNGITYTAIFQTGLTTYTDTVRPAGNVYYSIISVH